MIVRLAEPQDVPGLLRIYAPYVRNTAITFEYEVPTPEEFSRRLAQIQEWYPYLVAEEDGQILGYSYASAFKTRAAYDWSVETTIYVDGSRKGKGIGRMLYTALEECLSLQNICNLCACIAYPNPASIAFHEAFGYRSAAHFHKSGYKAGRWYDMIWMEKELKPHLIPPASVIPFPRASNRKEYP